MPDLSHLKLLTGGLYSPGAAEKPAARASGIVTAGATNALNSARLVDLRAPRQSDVYRPNANDDLRLTDPSTSSFLNTGAISRLPTTTLFDARKALTAEDLFDPSPAYLLSEQDGTFTYSGSDMRVFATLADRPDAGKQLVELATITISVFRVKSPARGCGSINPLGFARGTRTIAGTMILTPFWIDVLFRFLQRGHSSKDKSQDTFYKKVDQLPPLDLTLFFADEYGHASYRRLLGVECETDGTVYSIHDMYTEQTITFKALDFTTLLPVDVDANATFADLSARPSTPATVRSRVAQREAVESTISNIEEVF